MKKMGLAEDKDYPPFLEGIFFKYWKAVPDAYPKYIPDFSTGTTKEFFDEIKNRTLLGGREDIIYSYVESYKHN